MRAIPPCALLVAAGCASAVAATAQKEAPVAYDVSAIKDKLTFWSDGKKHFLALVMTSNSDSPIFWSADGKEFYELRIHGGGSEGDDKDLKRLDRTFWEPRVDALYKAGFDYKKDENGPNMAIQCSERKTRLEELPAADVKTLVAAAKFYKPRWNHYAYSLARDNSGKYYYVDNVREPEHAKRFRLWAGMKGAMKPQKMTNVVSDSEGDIFSTKSGSLRLILDKHETTWVQNGNKTKLVYLEPSDNHIMIYTDLGVYTGEPLGTPCDDL
ncbi:MAG: hypothetical protein LC659_09110 [Myxococcales bacterium]|nr:hypothetical protein [Myxococcales bacterium]